MNITEIKLSTARECFNCVDTDNPVSTPSYELKVEDPSNPELYMRPIYCRSCVKEIYGFNPA